MLRETKSKKRLNKKGVSVIIGYVLLVTLAVVMGGVMYTWMKSYVPQESLDCPEDTSIAIRDYNYNCATNMINLTLNNNGRFNIGGYFIHVSNSSNISVATVDLSQYLDVAVSEGADKFRDTITLSIGNNNSFSPNGQTNNFFNFSTSNMGQIFFVEITPWRWQRDKDNKLRFVSCGADSIAKQEVICS